MIGQTIKRLPRVLSPGEARLLLATTAAAFKHQAMIAIGLYAGLRCQEILTLQVGDIDEEEGLIRVRQGKGGQDATLPLNPKLMRYIAPFLRGREADQPLVPGPAGQPYSGRALRKIVTRAAAKAGLAGHVHVHTLRHTYGTELQRHGKDVYRTKRLMRHASIKSTELYIHLAVEDIRPLADELDFEPERLQAAVDTLDSAGP